MKVLGKIALWIALALIGINVAICCRTPEAEEKGKAAIERNIKVEYLQRAPRGSGDSITDIRI